VADVNPTEAKARLEAYLKVYDEWRALDAQHRASHVTLGLYPLQGLRGAAAVTDLEKLVPAMGKLRDELLRRADDVVALLKRVNVTGFNPHMPEDAVGRNAIVRALGQYDRWLESGRDPNPPAPSIERPELFPVAVEPTPSPALVRRKIPRWLVTALISTFTWLVGLFWGETKTCEPNIQRECKARDGSPGAQVCIWFGHGWSDCEAFVSSDKPSPPSAPSTPPP
jgi:hypothetical protein